MVLTRFHYEGLGKDIAELEAKVASLTAENADLRLGIAGKVTPKLESIGSAATPHSVRSHGSPDRARAAIERDYEKAKEIHDRNKAACQENARILSQFKQLFEACGVPLRGSVWNGRSRKSTYVDLDWWAAFQSNFPTTGYGEADRYRADALKLVDAWEKEIADARAAEQRARESKEAERQRVAALVSLAPRHGLPVTATAEEIRDGLFAKCKYLRLAFWLEKNRGDWSDGYDYARTGLDGFEATDEIDAQIVADLQSQIADWDGDGRCFRDCTWNYSRIRALCDADLLADWALLIEHAGGDVYDL